MDIQTLMRWKQTSSWVAHSVVMFLHTRYNSTLRGFGVDPLSFRSVLRLTGSVISGSTALHILDGARRAAWAPNDIDVYVPRGKAMRIVTHLQVVEDFHLTRQDSAFYGRTASGFSRVIHLSKGNTSIDIIESLTQSALHPIPYFWSTHLINYLTADSFCIAYPDHLLTGRGVLNPIALLEGQYPSPRTLMVMEKYRARGYDVRLSPNAWKGDPSAECDFGADCPRSIRIFGDRSCLVGSFKPFACPARHPPGNPDPRHAVRWWRGGSACGGRCVHLCFFREVPTVETKVADRMFGVKPIKKPRFAGDRVRR